MILLNKAFIFITFLIVTSKSYGQKESPTYILASKYFHSYNSIGVAVRFDNGIDSINFPIDTNKVNVILKKLDMEGKSLSDVKVYYEYQFTPKINGGYKLPNGVIWSKNKSFDMTFKDSIHLSIPDPIVKMSTTESINREIEKLNLLKAKNKEREEIIINSRIKNNAINSKAVIWTDHENYKVNDEIRIVVEVKSDFDFDDLNINLKKISQNALIIRRSYYKHTINDGKEFYYAVFICNAIKRGLIEIPQCKVKTKKKELETNSWQFVVTNN